MSDHTPEVAVNSKPNEIKLFFFSVISVSWCQTSTGISGLTCALMYTKLNSSRRWTSVMYFNLDNKAWIRYF